MPKTFNFTLIQTYMQHANITQTIKTFGFLTTYLKLRITNIFKNVNSLLFVQAVLVLYVYWSILYGPSEYYSIIICSIMRTADTSKRF